ncbi:MAG: glutaminyl-peptide cyclotransferase [Acidobacteria bacterium]|nr:glutaminyl-peptide cyclotransferase [Acidobacteriota bacterium]
MPAPPATGASLAPMQVGVDPDTPVYGYKIVNTYPHDRNAFTQGLIFDNKFLYESTGLNERSSLRKVELETGKVLQMYSLPDEYFGEGLALWQDKLIQLTWLSFKGFVYDKESFRQLREFLYPAEINEGWGITHDDTRLIMSDGTSKIYFLNPETFERIGRIEVHDNGVPVDRLNELEYIKGEIYANRWLTNQIYRISPQTGQVLGRIDLTGLLSEEDRAQGVDVLNGIAYDAGHDRLFVTGKLWPRLFEIELVPKS